MFSRGWRENVRAFPLRELHGQVTDAAAAGVNQHALAWLQLGGVEQRLPRGQRSQRHCRRADVMKRVRFEREFRFANDDIISVRAVAGWIRQAVNLVADFESGHASTEFLDYSGQVPSENEREFMRPEVFHFAFTNFPIDRVHSGRVNADEKFARLWLRTRRIFVVQDFRSAIVVNSNRFHGLRLRAGRFFLGRCACVFDNCFDCCAHWSISPSTWPRLLRASESAAVEAAASTECHRIRFAVLRASWQLAYLSCFDVRCGLMPTPCAAQLL